jgi:hypothetical protein
LLLAVDGSNVGCWLPLSHNDLMDAFLEGVLKEEPILIDVNVVGAISRFTFRERKG